MQPVPPCLLVLGLMVVGWHAGSSDAVDTPDSSSTPPTNLCMNGETCAASFDPVALQASITALEAHVKQLEGKADAIPKTCKAIQDKDPSSPSGIYYIQERYGTALNRVYCEMERDGGGWARVAVIRASWSCPASMLHQKNEKDICTRPMSDTGSCAGATFGVPYPYKEVTGFVTGYTDYTKDAFHVNEATDRSLDGIYADGVSITAGTPRKHIWTYAASSAHTGQFQSCPCLNSGGFLAPEFVGQDFYCSTTTTQSARYEFTDDGHAWSATDYCPFLRGCCNTGQPWFHRVFGEASSDKLEIRICNDQSTSDEDIGVDEAELFIR